MITFGYFACPSSGTVYLNEEKHPHVTRFNYFKDEERPALFKSPVRTTLFISVIKTNQLCCMGRSQINTKHTSARRKYRY